MNAYGLKHARPTKDQRDSFFFTLPPLPPSVANELASQESKMWFSGGGRILGWTGVRKILAGSANLTICPLKCPTTYILDKSSLFPFSNKQVLELPQKERGTFYKIDKQK